jgi:hypothetical protein
MLMKIEIKLVTRTSRIYVHVTFKHDKENTPIPIAGTRGSVKRRQEYKTIYTVQSEDSH